MSSETIFLETSFLVFLISPYRNVTMATKLPIKVLQSYINLQIYRQVHYSTQDSGGYQGSLSVAVHMEERQVEPQDTEYIAKSSCYVLQTSASQSAFFNPMVSHIEVGLTKCFLEVREENKNPKTDPKSLQKARERSVRKGIPAHANCTERDREEC